MKFETFTKADVDPIQLDIEVTELANKIYNSSYSMNSSLVKRKRTYEQVKSDCELGLVAERYLIEKCGFERSKRKYGDVVFNNIEIEVKAWRKVNSYITNKQLDRLRKGRLKGWYPCSQMLVFEFKNGIYTFKSLTRI
jgi:hypothetical protein